MSRNDWFRTGAGLLAGGISGGIVVVIASMAGRDVEWWQPFVAGIVAAVLVHLAPWWNDP